MDNNLSLKNQSIVVTGVSRSMGIGAAIARICAEAGAHVLMHGHAGYDANMGYPDAKENFSDSLEEELLAKGLKVTRLTSSDLSAPGAPEQLIDEAFKIDANLNGLVLNHAYSTHAPISEWTAEHIDKHFAVNVRASMLIVQAFAQQIKQKEGAITLFTSGQYLGPMISEIAYALSKEAIRGMTSQLSAALGPQNIRVNCVNPGPTDTGYLEGELHQQVANMFPSGRWGTPEDAAKLVQFLHSSQATWITGQTIASEGGFQR